MAHEPHKPKDEPSRKEPDRLPGEFLSDDLRDATSRFLDEVKRQVKRRRESPPQPRLGPPRRPKH
jgi:hypothetical protein